MSEKSGRKLLQAEEDEALAEVDRLAEKSRAPGALRRVRWSFSRSNGARDACYGCRVHGFLQRQKELGRVEAEDFLAPFVVPQLNSEGNVMSFQE